MKCPSPPTYPSDSDDLSEIIFKEEVRSVEFLVMSAGDGTAILALCFLETYSEVKWHFSQETPKYFVHQ